MPRRLHNHKKIGRKPNKLARLAKELGVKFKVNPPKHNK